jgi:MtrB/PioB family decaheme-associated outer membrane protein
MVRDNSSCAKKILNIRRDEMKLNLFAAAAVMSLLLPFSGMALAQEEEKGYQISGEGELGVRSVNYNNNSAKFQQYRDLQTGAYGNFYLDLYKGSYYLGLTGENVGQDDQFYELRGGKYDSFKYKLYYNEIIHNLSFNDKTFYTGIGGGNLNYYATNRAPNTDTVYTPNIPTTSNLWNTFDYTKQRKDVGGALEFSFRSPFFGKLEADHRETNGVQPLGAPSSVFVDRIGVQGSAFGNSVEMPAPIDYTTDTLSLTGGYKSQPFIASVVASYSKFENHKDYLKWRNPYVTTTSVTEVSSLPSDNDYWKILAQGLWRLPFDSALSMRGSYSKLENSLSLLSTVPSSTSGTATTTPTYTVKTLGLNNGTFDGDISYTTASVALTSHPIRPLDLKLYYNYLKKKDNSTQIIYTDPASGLTAENERFNYDNNNAGIDLGYRLPAKTKVSGGYEYLLTNRSRPDAESTTDNKVYGQVKNSYLNFLSAKVYYHHLWRSSDFANSSAGTGPQDPDYIERYVRRFDVTNQWQDKVKAGVEVSPLANLDFGVEYIYKHNDYNETNLGRRKDDRYEIYVDSSYAMPGLFRVTGFFDYETVKYDSSHRYVNPSGTYSNDPNSAPVANSYNWTASLSDYSWTAGIKGEVPLIKDKLGLYVSYVYEQATGDADFTSQDNFGNPMNITEYDNYRKNEFHTKLVYNLIKNLAFSVGYVYEKYTYDDAQYNGYTYVVGTPPNSYLTGAYANQNYEANIFYLLTSYKFF